MTAELYTLLTWVTLGLITGWLAGQFTKQLDFSLAADSLLGVVGALVGGVLVQLLGFGPVLGLWGTATVAFLGALVALVTARLLPPEYE